MPNVNHFPTTAPNSTNRMHECGNNNYWFYHMQSYPNDAPLFFQELISTATSHVDLWDPYVRVFSSYNDTEIFSQIQNNITLKILTMAKLYSPVNSNYSNDVKNKLKLVVPASKSLRFGLRVINRSDPLTHQNWFFHDRILIIDKTQVFHIGSSIGYHLMPEQSTGIYRVENSDTCAFILSIFDEYWKYAILNELPITYLHP